MTLCRHQDGAGPTQTAIMRKGLLAPVALLSLAPGALSSLPGPLASPHPPSATPARLEVRLQGLQPMPAGEIPLLGMR